MRVQLKFVFVAIVLGAAMLVAAQTLGRLAYGPDYYFEISKFVLAIILVTILSYKISYKRFIAFTFIISGLYGMGHILYDLITSYVETSDFTHPINEHVAQGILSVLSFVLAFFLLSSTKRKSRKGSPISRPPASGRG